MGKMVEKKKRKKKGRPSLLDLQKRNLKQQQEEQEQQQQQQKQAQRHKGDNSAPSLPRGHDPAAPRRSTRRNPIPDAPSPGKTDDDDEDDGGFSGKRREKKLKLVLKLPAAGQEGLPPGAGATGPAESSAEDGSRGNQRKRKMREIGDVSGAADGETVVNFSPLLPGSGAEFWGFLFRGF